MHPLEAIQSNILPNAMQNYVRVCHYFLSELKVRVGVFCWFRVYLMLGYEFRRGQEGYGKRCGRNCLHMTLVGMNQRRSLENGKLRLNEFWGNPSSLYSSIRLPFTVYINSNYERLLYLFFFTEKGVYPIVF